LIPLNNRFLWMTDLSMPERLTIFGVGIPLLAILVAITTYFSSKIMTPPPADPKDQAAAMGKMMNLYMPFLMGYISYTFSAGLAIYFVTGNIFRIAQYAIMGKVDWKTLIPFIKPKK
jgi:YidC/Oxa1 family membrane protein insertase